MGVNFLEACSIILRISDHMYHLVKCVLLRDYAINNGVQWVIKCFFNGTFS